MKLLPDDEFINGLGKPPKDLAVMLTTSQVKQHLRAIERKYYSLIRNTVEEQLQFEPDVETKNRKPLKRPVELEADWEIRFGPSNRFRVFYSV